MESLALHSFSTSSASFSRSSLSLRSRPISSKSQFSLQFNPNSPLKLSLKSKPPSPIRQFSLFPSKAFTFDNPLSKPHISYKSIQASSSSSPPPASPPASQGVKIIPFVISISIGLIFRFLVPKPVDVTLQAWQLLSIFLSTIAGLVLSPLPVGAWAFLGLTTSIVTKTLTFSVAFSAFTNEVIWLIVISFFFARGFVKTGLGDRIATYFVKWLGKSTLGLSYGLTFSEALIAPAMPSTTARAGGVFLPIIKSLSLSAGSEPGTPTARRLGSYLVQSQFQVAFSFASVQLILLGSFGL